MKKKSVFAQIIILIVIALIGMVITVCMAWLAGSVDITLFDWKNLNWSNTISVFIIGGILTCITVTVAVIFVSRSVFFKLEISSLKIIKTKEIKTNEMYQAPRN